MHREVMLIAPRFGNLTERLVDSFCTIYPEDQVGSYLYEESAYERRLGVALSRFLRVVVQILPCSTKLRRAVESFIGRKDVDASGGDAINGTLDRAVLQQRGHGSDQCVAHKTHHDGPKQQANQRDAALGTAYASVLLHGANLSMSNYWKEPIRFRLLKFIHTKKARPTMFWSGTKPQ